MKRPYSVGYFSSYDRGLECLLDMWPKIKEQVPEAVLYIYYGWNQFDAFHSKNQERMRWKWQMIKKMHDVGAIEHGRVNHIELAKAMKDTQVWAYPTEFTEIHCITALKAQEAGCIPVVTGVGALNETVKNGFIVNATDIYTNPDAQEDFMQKVEVALHNPDYEFKNQVSDRYWTDVAKKWDETLS